MSGRAAGLGWVALVGGLLAQAAAYVVALTVSVESDAVAWLSIVGITFTLTGTLMLGAVRRGRLSRPAGLAALALCTQLLGSFAAAMQLPAETAADPLWLGLPRRAAIVLLGVGVLPMLVLPLAYAWEFRADPLDAAALEQLRAEAARLQSTRSSASSASR